MCNKANLTKRFFVLLHTAPPLPPTVLRIYKQSHFGEAVIDLTKETVKDIQKNPSETPKVDLIPIDIPVALFMH